MAPSALSDAFSHIVWQGDALRLLDQRKLPQEMVYVTCRSVDQISHAIRDMVVRGAPAIGICAAYGAVLSVMHRVEQGSDWRLGVTEDLAQLARARPTAVNLMWAVAESEKRLGASDVDTAIADILHFATSVHEQDIQDNYRMAELACEAMSREEVPFSVITHCNTGSLATGGYGTALGAIRRAYEKGFVDTVFADETRPWLQGARLTAWELQNDGLPVVLNVEGAAAWIMRERNVRWVVVGADRITANGDVANKIGTYALAILARYHGVKFMVVAPSSTVDMGLASGKDIDIEMRDPEELTELLGVPTAPKGIQALNPVFDVTPADLVDVIVTEKGIVQAPNPAKMKSVFASG